VTIGKYLKDILKMIKKQENVIFISQMDKSFKDIVIIIQLKEMELLRQLMAIILMEFGKIMY
jgi:hypothetical protein